MKRNIILIGVVVIGAMAVVAHAYDITRTSDGPFAFSIRGIEFNEGSSLERESVLLNDETCPVQIQAHSMDIVYEDRRFRFSAETEIESDRPIQAIQLRTIQYDVFGQHMNNLANTEVSDIDPGNVALTGQWRARDAEVVRFLTSVTYVARVRLADGTQWVFDRDKLLESLAGLDLEQKIAGDESDDVAQ